MSQRLKDIRDTFDSCDGHAMRTVWYLKGEWTPHYPLPVPWKVSDIALTWDLYHPNCCACIEACMDNLEYYFDIEPRD